MRKHAIAYAKTKGPDQLRGDHTDDHHPCFRYIACKINLLPKFQVSSCFTVAVQPGLCLTWSETPKTGFLMTLRMQRCLEDEGFCTFAANIQQA